MYNDLIRLLWVEDEVDTGMVDRKNYIDLIGKYDIYFAKNASDAEKLILNNNFDVIIIDVRIPPGYLKSWQDEYINARNQRLGTLLIKNIIKINPDLLKLIGVFTIEKLDDINPLMDNALGFDQYSYKGDSYVPEMFEEFIQKILIQSRK